jgi:hypothetical protein
VLSVIRYPFFGSGRITAKRKLLFVQQACTGRDDASLHIQTPWQDSAALEWQLILE